MVVFYLVCDDLGINVYTISLSYESVICREMARPSRRELDLGRKYDILNIKKYGMKGGHLIYGLSGL